MIWKTQNKLKRVKKDRVMRMLVSIDYSHNKTYEIIKSGIDNKAQAHRT